MPPDHLVFDSASATKFVCAFHGSQIGNQYKFRVNRVEEFTSNVNCTEFSSFLCTNIWFGSWVWKVTSFSIFTSSGARIYIDTRLNIFLANLFKLNEKSVAQLTLFPEFITSLQIMHFVENIKMDFWTPSDTIDPVFGNLPHFRPCFDYVGGPKRQVWLLDYVFVLPFPNADINTEPISISINGDVMPINTSNRIQLREGLYAFPLLKPNPSTKGEIKRYVKNVYRHYQKSESTQNDYNFSPTKATLEDRNYYGQRSLYFISLNAVSQSSLL